MNKNNIIIDLSGSMKENGKYFLLRYIFQSIVSLIKTDDFSKFDFDIYKWQNDITLISSLKDIKDKDFNIKQNEDKLVEFFENNKDSVNMLITDGSFSHNLKNNLEKISKKTPLILLQIGNDFDISANKITKKDLIFKSFELISAIFTQCKLNKSEVI